MAVLYRVLNTGTNNTILMSNTMCLIKGAGAVATVADLNAGIGAIRTFYNSLTSLKCNSDAWIPGAKVTEFDPANPGTPGTIMGTTPGAVVTGIGGVQTINQAAACISWRTATAGRSYRGRTFIGVLAASAVAGGVFTSGQVGTFTNAANALLANLTALATPLGLVVYSPKLLGWTLITSGATDAIPDVLRSRKR